MKILVATKETQGQRKNDFCHANESEVVTFTSECDGESVDGGCGCRRSMGGTVSHKATTTMKLIESNMSKEDFKAVIRKSLETAGWLGLTSKAKADAWVTKDANELLRVASYFQVGDIIEKRGNKFQVRR